MIAQCLALGSLTAQQNYFIAGDTSGVLYYDIVPDISLSGIPYSSPMTYGIDIDLNGTDDFLFEAAATVSPGLDCWSISVKSYGSNKIAYSRIEHWWYLGIGLGYGDTINEDILFTDETVYLKIQDSGPSWYYYYSWTPGTYIPVCLITEGSPECIFGWIKVYDVTLEGITLDSYAVRIPESTQCLPEGITFETQAQIDSFQINYYGCTEIEGDVQISGDDISNLNGLSVMTSIGGSLGILYNPTLTNLSGLEGLTSITETLAIEGNDALTSLSGLDNVTSIGGWLAIDLNLALTNLTGLEGLISIEETLEIWENDALTSLIGLDNVTSIGGELSIRYNGALTSLTGLENLTSTHILDITSNDVLVSLAGLENLTSISDKVVIYYNVDLNNLTGLDNLTYIGGSLWIQVNDDLASLTGLDNVTSIGGGLWVEANDALTSLMGLDNIDATSISELNILNNPLLSICEVESVCDYLVAPGGTVEIHDNATGCNSQQEVEEACTESVEEINSKDYLSIFPNPAKHKVSISTDDGKEVDEVTIYTLTGQQVYVIIPESESIDISTLHPGMYIVEVTVEGRKVRQKLLVQR